MTFKDFQATGRDVTDLGAIPEIAAQGDFEGRAGRVYHGELFLERHNKWQYCLTLGNESRVSSNLPSLERDLFDWAVGEGYLE